ncbi:long-chain-fatty-acid--CoA ligase [Kocuria massiliensis]|uniref:long-chain-fatty-acid--CoA ligase n=1 Tax=Kocuria massiliensis TaxID=1926282 RepID=UPI000A1C9FDF|nr:long-chain-fatty-acid--CoA ligase [Kocuria massiliensis]
MDEAPHDGSAPTTQRRPWLKTYNPNTSEILDLPETSLVHVMERSVREAGSKTALEFFGAKTSYTQLGDQISRVAEGLRLMGVQPGDRVAIILPNCPQHIVAFYAILRVGGVVVEHNPLYTEGELRHQFENHGAKVAFVWDKIADKITDQPSDIRPRRVVAVNLIEAMPTHLRLGLKLPISRSKASRQKLEGPAPKTTPWRKMLKYPAIDVGHHRPTAHDTALLLYTSGTSGTPKGVMLTHRNLESNAKMGEEWIGLGSDEVIYSLLPLFHAYGMTLGLGIAMAVRAKLVLFPTVDLDLVFSAMKKTKPTILPAVPPVYQRMMDMARERGTDLSGIRYSVSGAMNLPPQLVSEWEAKTGGYLVEGYGLTECAPLVCCNPLNGSRRAGSIGVPFPSTDIRIVDPETLKDVEDGEPGELWVSGPQVFRGYWKNEEATHESVTEDGWLRTGDIVTMDDDGFLFVVDRLKEVIITGGFNVSPSEVETALKTSDLVKDAAVVGLPSPSGGEEVVAAVIMEPGHALDVEALRQHCYSKVTRYKVPRRIVELEDFPRSMLGKTLRREVKKLVEERID